MPAMYDAIKKSVARDNPGYSEKQVEKHAARIYNSSKQGKRNPVFRGYDKKKKPRLTH